ncbi:MAG: thymidine phosphorylase, partial [Anaerolineales bacterium]|nr:thymidine phosphorylase [Anaerolineales bacterium]
MRAVDIIAKKRDGEILTREEIDFFIQGFTRGEITDYQAAAWAMAVYLRGMTNEETTALTLSMAHSGETLDLTPVAPRVLDKHSSGGVGDKTTLVVAPLVAALGLPVGKMSGRGLGFSGGTLDKLESIPGFRADLDTDEFLTQLREHGIVVSGQTHDLAPADGKLYALRDVTATVSSLPLIASSIMSKKIAAGAQIIMLDVKVGRGAFMKTEREATALAELMVQIGHGVGRKVAAVISD